MNKKYLIAAIIICVIGLVAFFHKTELQFELICSGKGRDAFYPDAYVVIKSEAIKKDFFSTNQETKRLASLCIDKIDVRKYGYVVVYGKKVKRMYYSYKTTFCDDKSASYIKRWGADVIFIEYEDAPAEGSTFIYRIDKNEKLRGFYGT